MATYCEDYPCCGHTDGLGCNWTYTPEAREYDMTHAMCDHEVGVCDAALYDDYCCDLARKTGAVGPGFAHDPDCENCDPDMCPDCGCDEDDCECPEFIMEDQWLDGSYEE